MMASLTMESGAGVAGRLDGGQNDAVRGPIAAPGSVPAPARGVVRLGARTQSPPETAADDHSPSDIARLSADLAELRAALGRKDAGSAPQDDGAIVEIRDAMRHLEAYFSITLPPKLDEIITSKLSVVFAAEQAKARTRRWLALALCANLVLGLALAAEMQGGMMSRMVESASPIVRSGVAEASAAIGSGAGGLADLFARTGE
ncbi:hypothetical protein [Aureimonas mangrovi]|uniref:hypothetical protein n=1 Tax=Aureimonas mangrovi TaxID=2758041 RepID=UPI00163D8202|nr:hypothetical protein [Aureimonas mangrovi]